MTPRRIQLRRTKGWRKPEGAVVVARPSKWGNPFARSIQVFGESDLSLGLGTRIDLYADMVQGFWHPHRLVHLSDTQVLAIYEVRNAWLLRIGGHPTDVARHRLTGRDLACWCPLEHNGERVPCHADVLLVLANPEVSFPWAK